MELGCARRSLAALVLVCIISVASAAEPLPRTQPEAVGLSSERLGRITSTFRQYVAEGKLAGGVVLIARRGKLAYLQPFGFRDREAQDPMRADSIFRIASQTKALTGVSIMVLQEQGKLLLSDPVGNYLPEFAQTTVAVPRASGGYDVVPAKRPITIHDLLTHLAGLSYGENGPAQDQWQAAGIQGFYFANRNEPVGQTIARLAKLPFDAQPGEKWIYGYSSDVLGAVVEKVSGQKLNAFFRSAITGPLHMVDSAFYLEKSARNRLAVVYSTGEIPVRRVPDGPAVNQQGAYVEGPRKSFSGGAGLLSTAGDYARFLQMLLNGGELDGARILSRTSVSLMTTDALEGRAFNPGEGFGLGFSVVKDPGARGKPGSVGEFGWGGAYHSAYWVDPKEQMIVVYLTQLMPAVGTDDLEKIRALAYQAIVD